MNALFRKQKSMFALFKTIGNYNLNSRFISYKGVNYTPLIMPKLSPTATESKVDEWLVKEGDFVEAGDSYCNVETDKASVSYDAIEGGFVAKIFESSEKVPINSLIGVLVENEEDVAPFKTFKMSDYKTDSQDGVEKTEGEKVTDEVEESVPTIEMPETTKNEAPETIKNEVTQKKSERVKATPFAVKLAEEHGVDLKEARGTGILGAITKDDVLKMVETRSGFAKTEKIEKSKKREEPLQDADFEDQPLSAMRETIAARLLESKTTIPHFDVSMKVCMDKILEHRKKLNEIEGIKISVNDLIIKASALALKKVPQVNCEWKRTFIRTYKNVDVSVAVSTEKGLLTPIIKNANYKGLSEISSEMKALALKARENKLKPSEFIGGTFTISNLGMFGVSSFSAIINPPQSAILAVSSPQEEVYLVQKDGSNEVKTRKMMTVNLACDHRTIDGAKAAEWLMEFKKLIENPLTMLL